MMVLLDASCKKKDDSVLLPLNTWTINGKTYTANYFHRTDTVMIASDTVNKMNLNITFSVDPVAYQDFVIIGDGTLLSYLLEKRDNMVLEMIDSQSHYTSGTHEEVCHVATIDNRVSFNLSEIWMHNLNATNDSTRFSCNIAEP